MFTQILINTPKWVFVLFVALVWLGLKQMLPRRVGLNRMTIMPLAMTCLSLYGVTSVFGDSPQALLTWCIGAAVAFTLNFQLPSAAQITYDVASRRFQMPGSAVPLALFMGIFFTKYAVGISMGMQPSLAHNSGFALSIGALYGAFSGIFLARAAKLWRIALTQANAGMQKGSLA
nr:DUF6622 family protein [Rhodoferax sp.]